MLRLRDPDTSGKLLELADRGDEAETPSHAHSNGGGEPMEEDGPEEGEPGPSPDEMNVSSVITQVAVRQEALGVAGPRLGAGGVDDQEVRNTWKNKLR